MSSALILASAYAGWAGSLAPEVAEQRLSQALALADAAPEAFVDALLPTMFARAMPRETLDDFRASMQAFHPRGFRAMARASAEDVRDVLPHVDVPTSSTWQFGTSSATAAGRSQAWRGFLPRRRCSEQIGFRPLGNGSVEGFFRVGVVWGYSIE